MDATHSPAQPDWRVETADEPAKRQLLQEAAVNANHALLDRYLSDDGFEKIDASMAAFTVFDQETAIGHVLVERYHKLQDEPVLLLAIPAADSDEAFAIVLSFDNDLKHLTLHAVDEQGEVVTHAVDEDVMGVSAGNRNGGAALARSDACSRCKENCRESGGRRATACSVLTTFGCFGVGLWNPFAGLGCSLVSIVVCDLFRRSDEQCRANECRDACDNDQCEETGCDDAPPCDPERDPDCEPVPPPPSPPSPPTNVPPPCTAPPGALGGNTIASDEACGTADCWGDPHLVTLDGLKYDFQAVGEFILLQSDSGDLVVQVRQQPWGDSRDVAVNKAIMMKVNRDIVGIYEGQWSSLQVNGQSIGEFANPLVLPAGGLVYLLNDQYTVVWPDTSQLRVKRGRFSGVSYLDIKASVSPSRAGHVSGLLGNYDRSSSNDLVTRDGAILDRRPSFEQLYSQFANSWRITQEESLFLYGAGEDTETFTDRSFPDQLVTSNTLDPDAREHAEAICVNAGITDPALLEACIVDVGITGEEGLAESNASARPPSEVVMVGGRYFNDFEEAVGPEWSRTSTDVIPAGGRRFLGSFGNDTVSLSLSGLPAHNQVTVSFDLFINVSWDGNHATYGPEIWRAIVRDGQTLLNTTFTNWDTHRQAFPDPYPDGDNPAFTGASETGTLGYTFRGMPMDAVYHLSFTFNHDRDSLVLDFSAVGIEFRGNENWGLDNFEVELDTVSETALSALTKAD